MKCSCGQSREKLWEKYNELTSFMEAIGQMVACKECDKWMRQRCQMELEGKEPTILDTFRDVI